MEQQQRSLFFTAAVGLIILAIIVGSVYYLVKFIQSRVATSRQTPQASAQIEGQALSEPQNLNLQPGNTGASPIASTKPETKGGAVIVPSGSEKKVFNGGDFQLTVPKNWGILTCNNSKHFELDPNKSEDVKIACSSALKPITVLVDDIKECEGESIKLGKLDVIKSKKSDGGYSLYRYCIKAKPALNITHRVSSLNDPASSKEDYSKQIEEMITILNYTPSL